MHGAQIGLLLALLGGLPLAACAEDVRGVDTDVRSATPSAAPTRYVRGMQLPDELYPDCLGRFGEGGVNDYSIDPQRPSGQPADPAVVLEKYFGEKRGSSRPEASLYEARNFDRHDAKSYGGSTDPVEVARHGRWVGFRPDGTVFAVALLDRTGTDGGWVLAGDEGCSNRSPADRTPTPAPL